MHDSCNIDWLAVYEKLTELQAKENQMIINRFMKLR